MNMNILVGFLVYFKTEQLYSINTCIYLKKIIPLYARSRLQDNYLYIYYICSYSIMHS